MRRARCMCACGCGADVCHCCLPLCARWGCSSKAGTTTVRLVAVESFHDLIVVLASPTEDTDESCMCLCGSLADLKQVIEYARRPKSGPPTTSTQ
jgi:hypothetical protein